MALVSKCSNLSLCFLIYLFILIFIYLDIYILILLDIFGNSQTTNAERFIEKNVPTSFIGETERKQMTRNRIMIITLLMSHTELSGTLINV